MMLVLDNPHDVWIAQEANCNCLDIADAWWRIPMSGNFDIVLGPFLDFVLQYTTFPYAM